MFGKHFASMYSGSMFGLPAIVFAVWGYVIAHMRPSRKDGECYCELNPTLLAATFATTPAEVVSAIAVLEAADPGSRTDTEDGRRLIRVSPSSHLGPMQFKVINGLRYRSMRDEEERRAYLRDAKRKERARKQVNNVNNVNHGQPPSTQAEGEAEARNTRASARAADAEGDRLFDELWFHYPRLRGKQGALKAYRRSVITDQDRDDIRTALHRARQEFSARPLDKVPYGSTWFASWREYLEPAGAMFTSSPRLVVPMAE